MGEVVRDGILYLDFGQVIIKNTSLQRAPSPYFSVRMKGINQIGYDPATRIYGDELTWDQLEGVKILWGNNVTQKYTVLQPNYSYIWNVGTSTFSVVNASGNATSYHNVKDISDLGISYDIFESHQFVILLTASFDGDAFLIAKKVDPRSLSNCISYVWGQADEYVTGVTHFLSGAMGGISEIPRGETIRYIHQKLHIRGAQWLLSKAVGLYTTGNYPCTMFLQNHERIANRSHVKHNGVKNELGKLLMIHMFTRNKLKGSFPNSFPWMLFQSFKWLWDNDNSGQPYDPNGPGEARIYDRTFDLSPWWG